MASGLPDAIDKVTEVVPEVFYDLIARIAPGMLFLLAGAHALVPAWPPQVERLLADHPLWTLFIGGYVAGLLLAQGSVLVFDGLLAPLLNTLLARAARSGRRAADLRAWMGGAIGDQHLVPRIDAIAAGSPEAGRVLRKMLAEKVLIENLLTGSLVVVALQLALQRAAADELLVFAALCLPCWLVRVLLLAVRVTRMASLHPTTRPASAPAPTA